MQGVSSFANRHIRSSGYCSFFGGASSSCSTFTVSAEKEKLLISYGETCGAYEVLFYLLSSYM